jgi:hypothetical protein
LQGMNTRLRSAWGWLTPLCCSFRSASCEKCNTQYPIRYVVLYNCRECSSSATGTNWPYFMQNKANPSTSLRTGFWESHKDVKLIMTRDYEKYIYCKGHLVRRRRISENKANQSQSFDKLRTSFSGKGAWGLKVAEFLLAGI